MHPKFFSLVIGIALLGLCACGASHGSKGSAGPGSDSGGGSVDGSTKDGAVHDGASDTGTSLTDSGSDATGFEDTIPIPIDSGQPDSGQPDSGDIDSEPPLDSGPDVTATDTGAAPDASAEAATDATGTFPISGTLVGLATGDSVTLQDNGGDDLTLTANGAFTFAKALPPGAKYSVTVFTPPAMPTQSCVVANAMGTVSTSAVSVTVTCTTSLLTVGGTVTGLATGASLVLQNDMMNDLTVSANGTFTFATSVASGASYAVTILTQPTAEACTVTNASGTVAGMNVTTVSVMCDPIRYTIGGTLTGLAASDTVVLDDNGGDALTLNANGAFTFSTGLASGAAYTVTVKTPPSTPAQTCVVSAGTGTVMANNVTSVVVNCSSMTYTIGGKVSGLASGDTVAVQDNGGDTTLVAANGSFAFPTALANGAAYAVTVSGNPTQPVAETCVVTMGTGTVMSANVTSPQITCTPNSYTIGGTVTGLAAGGSFVLTNNKTESLTITGSTFTFPMPQLSGSAWSITGPVAGVAAAQTAAGSPVPQTCVVQGTTEGVTSGTVSNANVVIQVACTTNTDCSTLFLADGNERDPGDGDDYPSGVYGIDPTGAPNAGFPAYCDMVDQQGGWTLALKISGANPATLQTFSYDQPIWTSTTLLSATSTDMTQTEAKFQSYLSVPFTNLLLMMQPLGSTVTPNQLMVTTLSDATSLEHLIATSAMNTVTTSLGRTPWLGLANPSATPQPNCDIEGINQDYKGGARIRLGFLAGDDGCNIPQSWVGFGGEMTVTTCYPQQPYLGPAAGSAGGGSCGGGADVDDFGFVFVRP